MKNSLSAIIVALSILIGVFMLTRAYKNRNRGDDLVNVTGLGSKDFTSDLIVWRGAFSKQRMELKDAYSALKADQQTIKDYLLKKGVKEEEIVFSAVDIDKRFNTYYDKNNNRISEFKGYRLTQSVEINSKEVNKVESLSREITELINVGVELQSDQPDYYYTKLAELKVEMISAASQDARLRAEKIAENSNASLGKLRYAKMGVFQIIGQNSNEDYSWGGSFNTSSKEKTATITMKLQFGVD